MNSTANNSSPRLRIIVLGYIVRGPLGGLAWHHLHYVLGLAGLGHEVYFVEDSGDSAWSCYDPSKDITSTDPTYGLQFVGQTFDRVGLGDRRAYYDAHTSRWLGPCADRILKLCAGSDLLLNLSAVNPLRPWLMEIPARALVDTDPVFTPIRHLTDGAARSLALQHKKFFSFGENIGRAGCAVPSDGLPWQPTRQPVVLDLWPVTAGKQQGKFTTVMLWNSGPVLKYNGLCWGTKAESFDPYMDLPKESGHLFELAVGSPSAPRVLLCSKGWLIVDPREPTRDPWTYQRYIQGSKGEFSVAQHAYVVSRSANGDAVAFARIDLSPSWSPYACDERLLYRDEKRRWAL